MTYKLSRTSASDPDLLLLIKLLDKELWERNEERQEVYVSYNLLDKKAKCITVKINNISIACGAFRDLKNGQAEIKRMFVLPEFRGKGISKLVLTELEKWALEDGLKYAILETGIKHPEAISLYESSGYQRIENYGQYKDLPESMCMGKFL